jgi:predicted metal-dependent hydrolase
MEFKCSLCDYTSEKKCHITQHINRKIKCGEGNLIIISVPINILCDFCSRSFSTRPNLKRHLKTCNVKKQNLEEENKILKEEVNILKALNLKPNVSITNNTNNQINNVQIHLTPWNNPTLPENVEKYYNEALKKLFLSVPTIIKQIHFNKDHPENHNISIKNMRSGIAKVYNGKEWESMDEKDVIRTLIDDYESTLTNYASEKNPKYVEKMQKIKDRDSEDKVYDDLRLEVKRVIYDRNHMIKVKN